MPVANVTQYRKLIGTYNNKPRKPSDKSIRKAFRKARRSHESINTRSNNRNIDSNGASAVRALLMVGLAASLVSTSAAMSNGQLKDNSASARATFPYLGRSYLFLSKYCSSVRLNDRQLLTAKHCIEGNFRPWSWTDSSWGWDWVSHQLNYPDESVDLSILTFDTNLQKNADCIPIMSNKTRALLENNSHKNACGSGPIIVLGNGDGENAECLQSAVFDFHNTICLKDATSTIKGTSTHNKPAHTNGGDSGAAIMGCNPDTGGYELMGINVAGGWDSPSKTPESKYSCFVDIAYFTEISDWIQKNTQQYTCKGAVIKGGDLYDVNYDYNENHQCHNWQIRLFSFATIAPSILSIATVAALAKGYSCKKRRLNFPKISVPFFASTNNAYMPLEEIEEETLQQQ